MRAVIPVGRGRPNTLAYAARALERHAGVTELWTVGEHPTVLTPDRHIDSPNDQRAAYLNVQQHLRAVLDMIDGDRFVWTADDVFTLSPWRPGVYVRRDTLAEHLRTYPNKGHYSRAVRASIEIVRGLGYDPEEVPTGAGHRPWLVDPHRAEQAAAAVQLRGEGEWMMVYVAGLEDVTPVGNAKVHGHGLIAPDADVASTDPRSWRYNAGRHIRATFREPSRWE